MKDDQATEAITVQYLAKRQLHVQPAPAIAVLTVMATSTAASVFFSFGILVWRLVA